MNTIIGNIISLVASIIMIISGYVKSRQKTLYWQTIQVGLSTIACFVLGAISGGIVNLLSIPRNILAYKDKLLFQIKLIIWLTTISLSIYFNTNGIIGYFPLISTTTYIFLMDKLTGIKFKVLTIFTMVIWTVHDFYVKNYVQVAFNVSTVIASIIAIYRINKESKE